MTALTIGKRYDFHTTDGTVYENAELKAVDDDGGCVIQYGLATLYIARHEYQAAHLCFTQPPKERPE